MPEFSSTRALSPRTMRSGRVGAETLREARGQFERVGVETKTLRRCDPEGATARSCQDASRSTYRLRTASSGWSSASSATARASRSATSRSASDIILGTPTRRPSTRSRTGGSMASCHKSLSRTLNRPRKTWSRNWSPTPANSAELLGQNRSRWSRFAPSDTFRLNF